MTIYMEPIEHLMSVNSNQHSPIGYWQGDGQSAAVDSSSQAHLLHDVAQGLFVVADDAGYGLVPGGDGALVTSDAGQPVLGHIPACHLDSLGDASFCRDHGIRYPYVAGAMANGIASVELVEAMARGGMTGFFGAAGLPVSRVADAVSRLKSSLGDLPFGVNVIHSPNDPVVEMGVVNLLLDEGVHLVEASAFLKLTPPVVKYRVKGIHRNDDGEIVAPNKIIAKVSREELAERFFSPPPEKLLAKLVESGDLTSDEAELAKHIPMAQDITAEADSGGHTDHRPALALLPTLLSLRNRMQAEHGYNMPLRVGLAGGISTPASAAAAFAMGAAYIMTGSVNQACVESGTSDTVRDMLAETRQADVARAPAADMFEMGVTVQVLKRGTMFSMRGGKLYELYRACGSLDEIPPAERAKLEKQVFRQSLDAVWESTRTFFLERDPRQVERAERDPKHKMALVFRWYLGQSSNWANQGVEDRQMDYQIWCGPAMGAFNEWVRGSFLEETANRRVVPVAMNILYGAAVLQRVSILHNIGVTVPSEAADIRPREFEEKGVSAASSR